MNVLDIARGAYAHSPIPLKRAVAPILSLAPAALKYGRAYRRMRERIIASERDARFAGAEQLALLRSLLAKAHAGSPFWRDRLDRALGGIDLAAVTRDHLISVPVVTKVSLRALVRTCLPSPSPSSIAARRRVRTASRPSSSGGTRIALCGRSHSSTISGRASAMMKKSAKAVLRGIRLDNAGRTAIWDPALRELRLAVFPIREQDVARYLDLIDHHGVRYLNTYPSALEIFCRTAIAIGRRPRRPLLGIFPISEPVYPHQRRLVRQALGDIPVLPFYGLGEKTSFAGEVPGQPGTYEFEPLYGIAELVDDEGAPITEPGREGRLVGTGFISTGMPFIRYDSGDRAVLVQPATAENGGRLRVKNIVSRRKADHLVAADGTRVVTPDLTPEAPEFFRSIRELQFRQEVPGAVVVRYVPSDLATPESIEAMRVEFARRAEGRIQFTMRACEQIFASDNGKRAFVDQRIGR